jgi:hypothetical protein
MPVITNDSSQPEPSRHEVIYSGEDRRIGADRRRAAVQDEKLTATTLAGGSSLEVLGGVGAAVLSIIGLVGYLPMYMAAISTIVIGGALLAHGAAVTARWSDTMRRAAAERTQRVEVSGGIGSEILGGMCGIVLGIIALAGVAPLTLMAVSAIAFGGAILFSAPAQADLARLAPDRDQRIGRFTFEAVEASMGTMVLAGAGAIVLGILSLVNVGPALTLIMVATLAIGCALLVTAGALTARFARRLQQLT